MSGDMFGYCVVYQFEMRCVKISYLPDLREKYHSRVMFFPLLVFE